MRKLNKKMAIVATGAGLALVASGIAYAYWTTTGLGQGSATAKASNGTVTLHAIFSSNALAPGLSTPVTFTADNPGATDLYVGDITLDSVTTSAPGCAVADFTMPNVTSNTVVIHGAVAQAIAGTGSVSFANDPVNSQDNCKSATVTLHVSSN